MKNAKKTKRRRLIPEPATWGPRTNSKAPTSGHGHVEDVAQVLVQVAHEVARTLEEKPALQATLFDATERTRPEEEDGVLPVSFINDITERKRFEEELIRSQRVHTLGEMAADVAHNFNTLLAVVLGRAQFLLLHLEDGTLQLREVRGNLAAIEQAALRGAATIRRLLDFTRDTAQLGDAVPPDVEELLAHTTEPSPRPLGPNTDGEFG